MCRYSIVHVRIALFFFQAEDGIRDDLVTGVQTCALPIYFLRKAGGPSRIESGTGFFRKMLVEVGMAAKNGAIKLVRSEERRVGKGVDLGGRRIIKKKKEKASWRAAT